MLCMLETPACGDGDALFAHVVLDGDLLSEPVQQMLEGLTAGEGRAPKLCAYALYGGAIYAGVGFVVCNMIWPNFYFEHVEAGKNVWLAGQWLAIAIYIGGLWPSVSALKANHLQ